MTPRLRFIPSVISKTRLEFETKYFSADWRYIITYLIWMIFLQVFTLVQQRSTQDNKNMSFFLPWRANWFSDRCSLHFFHRFVEFSWTFQPFFPLFLLNLLVEFSTPDLLRSAVSRNFCYCYSTEPPYAPPLWPKPQVFSHQTFRGMNSKPSRPEHRC